VRSVAGQWAIRGRSGRAKTSEALGKREAGAICTRSLLPASSGRRVLIGWLGRRVFSTPTAQTPLISQMTRAGCYHLALPCLAIFTARCIACDCYCMKHRVTAMHRIDGKRRTYSSAEWREHRAAGWLAGVRTAR
jgi:hypothetical protein